MAVEIFRRRNPGLLEWSIAFRTESSHPLDFGVFPFQPEIYEAFGDKDLPSVDVMKSAQCGITAAGVSLALYAVDVWQANTLYVLPTEPDAFTVSDTRFKTAIDDSPYLASRVVGSDSKGLKQIGKAFLYIMGSVAQSKSLSRPGDLLIFDEFDKLDQRNIPNFEKRLGAPTSLKIQRTFSNPTFEDAGIHALYQASDQRQWFVTCPACSHEAMMAWDGGDGLHYVNEELPSPFCKAGHIHEAFGDRVCGRCHRALPAEAVAAGRWVATKPRVVRRGYHISKLMVPTEDIAALVAGHHKVDESSVQSHCNMDLGLPYSPEGGRLTRELVLKCRRSWPPPGDPWPVRSYSGNRWVTAGVDVGRVLHVRISYWTRKEEAVPLFIGEIKGFEDLAILWDRYHVNFGLIDERPEVREARRFMARFPDRCMLTRWAGDDQREEIKTDEKNGLVLAQRTWSCDQLVAAFKEQTRLLPREVSAQYIQMLTAPYRVVEDNARGQKVARFRTERKERDDHFFFSEAYDLLARLSGSPDPVDASGPPPESLASRARGRQG